MSIQSPCLFEFIPTGGSAIVLLPVGGWLTEPPSWDASQDLLEVDGIDQASAYFKPLGKALVTLKLPLDEERLDFMEAFLEADLFETVPLLNVDGVLRVTSPDHVFTYTPAVVSDIAPSVPGTWGPELARVLTIQAAVPVAESPHGGTYLRTGGGRYIRPSGGTFTRL